MGGQGTLRRPSSRDSGTPRPQKLANWIDAVHAVVGPGGSAPGRRRRSDPVAYTGQPVHARGSAAGGDSGGGRRGPRYAGGRRDSVATSPAERGDGRHGGGVGGVCGAGCHRQSGRLFRPGRGVRRPSDGGGDQPPAGAGPYLPGPRGPHRLHAGLAPGRRRAGRPAAGAARASRVGAAGRRRRYRLVDRPVGVRLPAPRPGDPGSPRVRRPVTRRRGGSRRPVGAGLVRVGSVGGWRSPTG